MSTQVISLKSDEAVGWFLKRLKNALSYGLSSKECKMFEIFITSTLTDVDIKKQIINTVLPTFFESIVSRKVKKSTIDAQASIIRLFMKYYGATCGQFKNSLDKFTLKTINEYFNEENIMFKVTKYLALYSQCGGRGQQGINHAEAWTCQFNDYLYSANYFLNQLYSNVNFFLGVNVADKYEGKFDISVFNLSELGKTTPKERYEKLTSIFIFFNTAIQSMLLSMFSSAKRFDTNKVIQFVLSTLSVTSEKLNTTMITEDVIELELVLWKIHCSVIKTISALIKCCGRILIPQGTLICRILLQSLIMTNFNSSNAVYGTTRFKLKQRILTYQVLRSWLAAAGSQSSLEIFSENLTSGILFDIKYDKPSLNLIVDTKTGNKKRKSSALNQKIMNQRDAIVMHDYHANKTVCNEAHLTLQLFLNTLSSNLKPLQFKIFQSTIMGLLLEIIKYKRPNDYPLPYYDDLCRLNLYKSLLSIIISPHPQCITQTSVALRIFTLGTIDRNEKIKEVCRSSLSKLEHIIHPRNDTLFFPLENKLETPESIQSVLPENKTHFLNEIIEDTVMSNKLEILKDLNTNNIEPIIKCSETTSTTIVESYNNAIKNTIQEIIVDKNKNDIEEKPIIQQVDFESSNEVFTKAPIDDEMAQTNTVSEQMNVDDLSFESKTTDTVAEMLKDFIDSD